jgi:hypothetical protein
MHVGIIRVFFDTGELKGIIIGVGVIGTALEATFIPIEGLQCPKEGFESKKSAAALFVRSGDYGPKNLPAAHVNIRILFPVVNVGIGVKVTRTGILISCDSVFLVAVFRLATAVVKL